MASRGSSLSSRRRGALHAPRRSRDLSLERRRLHHEKDLHRENDSNLPLRDLIFGTVERPDGLPDAFAFFLGALGQRVPHGPRAR